MPQPGIFASLPCFGLLWGCPDDEPEEPTPPDPPRGRVARPHRPPDMQAVIADPSALEARLDRIYERAVADDINPMPPAGGPTDEGRQLLGEWLDCGAPK